MKRKLKQKMYEVEFTWFDESHDLWDGDTLDLGLRKEKFFVPASRNSIAGISTMVNRMWPNNRDFKIKIVKQ